MEARVLTFIRKRLESCEIYNYSVRIQIRKVLD